MTISKAIGIDLGTMFAGVAVWEDDHATLILNEQNQRRTPSVVAFTKKTRLMGDDAMQHVAENPKGTVYDLKRLVGRHYYDFQLQDDIETWPFSVVNVNDEPMIAINVRRGKKLYSPEDMYAMVLQYLKRMAEQHIKASVEACVIAVPVYFNYHQREATRKAAKLAGLKLLQLIDEPTAAALAYSMHTTTGINTNDDDDDQQQHLDNSNHHRHYVLVVDFGGDSLQVMILDMQQELIKIKATGNDMHLGGKTLTTAMVDDVINQIKETRGISNISLSGHRRQQLQAACERAKRKLSFVATTHLALADFFRAGDALQMVVTRAWFEELNDAVFVAAMDHVEHTLKEAQLDKDNMEHILLVGGSTHIPKFRQLLTDYFGQTPNVTVRPEEAVALGAAIQAAVVKGDTHGDPLDTRWTLDEVAPVSLGAEVADDLLDILVVRGMPLPAKQSVYYTLWNHKQMGLTISIYQGERRRASENTLLGSMDLDGHYLSRRGEGKVEVEFSLNHTGTLTVKARCLQNSFPAKKLRINMGQTMHSKSSSSSSSAIDKDTDDDAFVMKVKAKQALEQQAYKYLYSTGHADGTKEQIEALATKTLEWISHRSWKGSTLEDYDNRRQHLLSQVDAIKDLSRTRTKLPTVDNPYWYSGIYDGNNTMDDALNVENSGWSNGILDGNDDDDGDSDGDDEDDANGNSGGGDEDNNWITESDGASNEDNGGSEYDSVLDWNNISKYIV
ncbi:unnamed protein product [Absidia cylindrospora]